MCKYIYLITENKINGNNTIYVRANDAQIEKRKYLGGFRRFNCECYDEATKHPEGDRIEGKEILSLSDFDKWMNNQIL